MARDSPLLTPKQWEALTDPDEDMSDADKRTHRSRGRSRIRDIVNDFAYLLSEMRSDDRDKVFKPFDAYRMYREEKRQRGEDALKTYRESSDGQEPSDVNGLDPLSGATAPRKSDKAKQGEALHRGTVATLAFLYGGVGDREEFTDMVEQAIRAEREARGYLPAGVDVSITIEREHDREELLEEWENLSDEEKLEVIDSDPRLLFDSDSGMGFASDDG